MTDIFTAIDELIAIAPRLPITPDAVMYRYTEKRDKIVSVLHAAACGVTPDGFWTGDCSCGMPYAEDGQGDQFALGVEYDKVYRVEGESGTVVADGLASSVAATLAWYTFCEAAQVAVNCIKHTEPGLGGYTYLSVGGWQGTPQSEQMNPAFWERRAVLALTGLRWLLTQLG